MARTRDKTRPSTAGKPGYITEAGYKRLSDEAVFLWEKKRPEVTKALAAAAAEGDRSENAEYIYRKKQLGEIDRRLRFLRKRLDVLTVVSEKPVANGRVYFGCYVTIEDEQEVVKRYRIVGPDEWDIDRNEISMDSPMGKALMGKREDDEVTIKRPSGEIYVVITDVSVDP